MSLAGVLFLKNDGPFNASFSLFSSFIRLMTVNKCSLLKIADGCMRTRVLLYWK